MEPRELSEKFTFIEKGIKDSVKALHKDEACHCAFMLGNLHALCHEHAFFYSKIAEEEEQEEDDDSNF